jgi:hypothetical protein
VWVVNAGGDADDDDDDDGMYVKRAFVEAAPHDEVVALARGDIFRRMKRPPVVNDRPACSVVRRSAVCEAQLHEAGEKRESK